MTGSNSKWAGVRSFVAAFVASLGAFLFGLDIGYIAPILECASFKRDVGHLENWADPNSQIPPGTVGLIVGIFSIGCIIASLPFISSYFLDVWGRRSSIILGSIFYLASCIIQARAMNVATMYVGRLITGLSIGLLSSVVPVYLSEMAHPSIRGALTSMYQLMITAGILVAAFLDMFLVVLEDGWRTVIWLQCAPGLVILICMPLLPRSPRWLVQVGRSQEAKDVLDLIRFSKKEAEQEYQEIVDDFKVSQQAGKSQWAEVFCGRGGKLVAIGASLQVLQQLVGMNAFMYFGPRIFTSIGYRANTFQTINNAINFVATFPALFLVDRAGRKMLLIVGAVGMMVSCVIMGILGLTSMTRVGDQWHTSSNTVAGLLAASVFFFVMNFACTWGPIVWVYCCEIYPLKIRARAVGVSTTANWAGNFIIAQVSPILLESMGFGLFFIFAFFCFLGLGLVLWLPETKGVKLENIDALFDQKFGEAPARVPDATGTGGEISKSYGTVDVDGTRIGKIA